jgi:hypothetical protein
MRDLMNNIDVKRAISPVSVADNTAQVSQIIDRRGFDSLTFVIALGSLVDADATFTVLVEHDDAAGFGTATAVPASELVGTTTLASFQFDDDHKCRKIGYVGNKRYVRMTITPANNSSSALIAAVAILSHAAQQPLSNPPA